jgi:hypothetical protein
MTLRQKRLISLTVLFGSAVFITLFVIGADVWIHKNWGAEATVSYAMRDLNRFGVFWWGFCTGGLLIGLSFHFWFSVTPKGFVSEDEVKAAVLEERKRCAQIAWDMQTTSQGGFPGGTSIGNAIQDRSYVSPLTKGNAP